jgi:hypothetical protein
MGIKILSLGFFLEEFRPAGRKGGRAFLLAQKGNKEALGRSAWGLGTFIRWVKSPEAKRSFA